MDFASSDPARREGPEKLLGAGGTERAPERALLAAREIVATSQRIVVLTGAGISTDSGIPDFRGPSGIWTKNPELEMQATIQAYLTDPEIRRRSWRNRLESPTWQASPNPGHFALVELERRGVLDTLVTQNIDGLHQQAGSSPERVIEIHGTMREVSCMSCGDRMSMEEAVERVKTGEEDLRCLETNEHEDACGGILKAATISFGQSLVPEDLDRAQVAACTCDLMLAVGSTLSVYPAAGLVPVARAAGARVVIVNAEPTEYDDIADVVVRGSISEVLPAIVATG
jgi:NAD-dependent deacetylase